MMPLFYTLHSKLEVMVLPDTLAHLDGHTIITETYSAFKANGRTDPLVPLSKESLLHLEKVEDPDYLGRLHFEIPDKLFTYMPGNHRTLDGQEVQELIEWLSHIRGNPQLWPRDSDNNYI